MGSWGWRATRFLLPAKPWVLLSRPWLWPKVTVTITSFSWGANTPLPQSTRRNAHYLLSQTRHCSGQLQTWAMYQDNQSHHCSLIIKAAASIHFLTGTPYTLLLVNFKTIFWSKMLQSSPSCREENQGPESKWAELPSWKGWSWGLTQAAGCIWHPLHQPTVISQSYTHAYIRHTGNEKSTSWASQGQLHFRDQGQGKHLGRQEMCGLRTSHLKQTGCVTKLSVLIHSVQKDHQEEETLKEMSGFHWPHHFQHHPPFLPPSSHPMCPGQHLPKWPCFTQHTAGTQLSSLYRKKNSKCLPGFIFPKPTHYSPIRLLKREFTGHTRAHTLPTHPSSLPLLISPIMTWSVSSHCANSSPSPVFIPFRCLQAIIMYPLSQAAHIKFFSSFLINQSLNPSKPFNRTSCSSLNSIQFPQVSDNVVTRGWMQGSSCWLSKLPERQGAVSVSVSVSVCVCLCVCTCVCVPSGKMDSLPSQLPVPFLQPHHHEVTMAIYRNAELSSILVPYRI